MFFIFLVFRGSVALGAKGLQRSKVKGFTVKAGFKVKGFTVKLTLKVNGFTVILTVNSEFYIEHFSPLTIVDKTHFPKGLYLYEG